MNWLRRIIPWAFEHDMECAPKLTTWDVTIGAVYIKLRCQRCGFVSDKHEIRDWQAFARSFRKRGCRGAP